MREKSSIVLIFAIAQAMAQPVPQSGALPKFEDFKVTEIFKGKPAVPVFQTPGQRMFRTKIREGAKAGANFAGHYAIAQWGCGSECVSIAIIDEKTGTVYAPPFDWLGYPPPLTYADVVKDTDAPLTYKVDSRLLIVRGCAEDKDCASFYYEWTGSLFKLLRKLPAIARKP